MYDHSDPYLQLWRDEPISVNDCILRNIHKYQYIANIDNDEIILPEEYRDWHEMLSVLINDTADIKVKISSYVHLANCCIFTTFSDSWCILLLECLLFGSYARDTI